ncbi:MAG: hypothetical protein WAT71_17760 [Ignavibacteria bacterium]
MNRSAFIEVLKTFTKQDIKEFGLLIQSQFFNTNQSVIKLFDQIKKEYPDFNDKLTDKKLLFEKAFGKIEFDDSFMRMTIFRLLELAKEFLVIKNLQSNYEFKETILMDELNNRELNNILMKSVNDLDKKLEKQNAKDSETYYVKYKLEYFRNDIKSRDTKMITYKDALNKDLMMEQKFFNTYFFINSLKFFQYFLNQKNFVVNTDGYPDLIIEILEFLKQNPEYIKDPELNLYFNLVMLLITKEDKYFNELFNKLFEDKDDLKLNSKHNLITGLRNHAQQKIHEGHSEYMKKSFEILKLSLKKEITSLTPSGKYMTETRFMTIVWSGLLVKEFEFTEKFIKKYIDKIEPEKREYVSAYNSAKLEFEKGNFKKAMDYLGNSGQIKNVFYKAASKQLNLMISYELKMFVSAEEQLDSYRHFVKTDKLLPEMYKTQSSVFINFFSRILKLNDVNSNNSFEAEKLISELKLTPQTWLLKKAIEFS